jgi:hypothetical protein
VLPTALFSPADAMILAASRLGEVTTRACSGFYERTHPPVSPQRLTVLSEADACRAPGSAPDRER